MRFVDAVEDDAARFVAAQEDAYAERLAALGIDEDEAWRGYKLLQVWDRLSLYACLQDLESPQPMRIEPVPYGGEEIPLDLVPHEAGRIGVAPYVFGDAPAEFSFTRRLVPKADWPDAAAFRRDFFAAPTEGVTLTMEPV
jgi:hypothetical protein